MMTRPPQNRQSRERFEPWSAPSKKRRGANSGRRERLSPPFDVRRSICEQVRSSLGRLAFWLGVLLVLGPPLPRAAEPAPDAVAGRALAAELRAAQPAEDAHFSGRLKIRSRDRKLTSLPFHSRVIRGATNWAVTYEAGGGPAQSGESLRIVRSPTAPNEYWHFTAALTNPAPLAGVAAMVPFAGSDFWLADLGLEFFHWPEQRLVKKEMRKGRPCRVLESLPGPAATPGPYARVLSWIDNETGGVIMAEAYDPQRKLLKEFELKSFKKDADGRWHLQEMEIRNTQTKTRTWMEFEVP